MKYLTLFVEEQDDMICVGCGEQNSDCICGERYETEEELIAQEEL